MELEELLKKTGAKIAQIRKKKSLSNSELARLCDIDRPQLIRIQKGKINVTLKTLLIIAKNLGVTINDLIG